MNNFEEAGKLAALARRKAILLIPDNVSIGKMHLKELTNEEFVKVFKKLQKLVIKIYEDIEKSPFSWGYPDFETTEGYYNRVVDFLFAFVFCGSYKKGTLTVNTKSFFAYTCIKRHKKPELMISGFEKLGFAIDGFDKKSTSFNVQYLADPNIITVLDAYVHGLGEDALHWSAKEMCKWNFSYRFVEDDSSQKYENVFYSKMDLSSKELMKIQNWLHEEAEKYEYRIDISHPYEKGCVQYQKGSKIFLLVGEKEIDGVPTIFSKVIFRDAFDKEKEKVMELFSKFPDVFKSNCHLCNGSKSADSKCSMRICYDIEGKPHRHCAYLSFNFLNPTLNDLKDILELFILENKIKKI
jgi:hypothetical protein